MKPTLTLFTLTLSVLSIAYADTVINNNNYSSAPSTANQPQSSNSNCGQNTSTPAGTPPGKSVQSYSDGTTSNIYSTGTKEPYIVDNGCNNQQQPVIQPYVGMPYGPRPHPGPGPRGR